MSRTLLALVAAVSLLAVPSAAAGPAVAADCGAQDCAAPVAPGPGFRCAGPVCEAINAVCYAAFKAPCVR